MWYTFVNTSIHIFILHIYQKIKRTCALAQIDHTYVKKKYIAMLQINNSGINKSVICSLQEFPKQILINYSLQIIGHLLIVLTLEMSCIFTAIHGHIIIKMSKPSLRSFT